MATRWHRAAITRMARTGDCPATGGRARPGRPAASPRPPVPPRPRGQRGPSGGRAAPGGPQLHEREVGRAGVADLPRQRVLGQHLRRRSPWTGCRPGSACPAHVMMLPTWIGHRKSSASIDAVASGARAYRTASIAAASSTTSSSLPANISPPCRASSGKTNRLVSKLPPEPGGPPPPRGARSARLASRARPRLATGLGRLDDGLPRAASAGSIRASTGRGRAFSSVATKARWDDERQVRARPSPAARSRRARRPRARCGRSIPPAPAGSRSRRRAPDGGSPCRPSRRAQPGPAPGATRPACRPS